jgi:hypothetical protein
MGMRLYTFLWSPRIPDAEIAFQGDANGMQGKYQGKGQSPSVCSQFPVS